MPYGRWEHVSESELVCKLCGVMHGTPHPLLLDTFETLRAALGDRPIFINDACRCQARQDSLIESGAPAAKSHPPHVVFHTDEFPDGVFHAMDISSSFYSGYALAASLKGLNHDLRIGVNQYGGRFCHFDVCYIYGFSYWRPGARW